MERRVAELSRRGPYTDTPLCSVSLSADVTSWDVDRKDVQPVTSWYNPDIDTHGMWRYNQGGQSYVELPTAGRYSITVQTRWQAPGSFNPNSPNSVATSIVLNSSSPGKGGITEATAYMLPGANTCYSLVCDEYVFDTGDRLKFNFWSQYRGVRLLSRTIGTAYTGFVVRYVGPR